MNEGRKIPLPSGKYPDRSAQDHDLAGGAPSESGQDPFLEQIDRIGWKDLKLFLDVTEAGGVRAGATKARCSINTIRRRLARIEDILGHSVGRRGSSGFELTETGTRLRRVAQDMQVSREVAKSDGSVDRAANIIRLAITDGLGAFWLMRHLVEFQRLHPDLFLHLHCDMQRVDVLDAGFDIAVQLEPPTDERLLCDRLCTLHLMPFAAQSYIDDAGMPKSVDDWPSHRLIWQEADQVASHLLPFHVGTSQAGGLIKFVTNSSSAHFKAIANGAGIGLLPTYAPMMSAKLSPIDLDIKLKRGVFCLINPARSTSKGVSAALLWLRRIFSGEKNPWFRDHFVHPKDFEQATGNGGLLTLVLTIMSSMASPFADVGSYV